MKKERLLSVFMCVFIVISIIFSVIFYSFFNHLFHNGGNPEQIILYSSIIFTIFNLIIIIILGITFFDFFMKSFAETDNLLYSISQGDLTKKVDLNRKGVVHSLYINLNNLIVKFRGLVAQIMTMIDKTINYTNDLNEDAENVKRYNKETTSVINHISKRMEEQMVFIKNAKDYSVDVISSAENIADRSETISKMTHANQKTINDSYKNFEDLILKMNESAKASMETIDRIKKLGEKTSTIQSIVDQVSEISEETNLLALNASIEAARAGESGKGFAVVAEEVKVLAESSSQQAKEIQSIVDGIKNEIIGISSRVEYETKSINEYIEVSKIAKEYLNKMHEDTKGTFTAFAEIGAEIEEQVNKVNKIGSIVENACETFESISASTQEVAASSQEQYSITENTVNRLGKLLDMNKQLENYISGFIKNYKIDEKTKKYINSGMESLKKLAKIPELQTMEYRKCTNILKEKIKNNSYFELIALMQKDGLRKAITLDYKEDQVYVNFAHRPYFKEAILGKEFMSEPYISVDTNNYCIAMSVPIRNEKGEILGILMADLVL
ncbi:chemotaxis protein [Clostridium carboxidivorans P7]|uniref:Methyl-accepting chemotaxis sensory transducer n=1 Tax=Clostridium carboxidivorans P7 TaxID=536227 RepID=C6PVH7_9CLOT|nr:methyl-accepting chemotaxis protein [Clostridium carboxidivorans]AKN29694.1 chemotaxis protein [Clostridium carboxidivorans P7]EET86742.1 methyl-accepting chemotaxis sensory transducer [Clostridium carboxidivorans P7]EFG89368.1 methyl-accepting chemotaxis protein signaling domain protein [Clostridium carboxidivorans P7]